jgi:hypothetical protein
MTTALQLVTRAFQKAGVLFKTDAPTADEANDAFSDLNNMIASWSNSTNCVYALTTETFNLVAGQADYTWGYGGNFNSIRPINIQTITVNYPSGVSLPVELITDQNYSLIPLKTIQGVPEVANISNGYNFNNVTFYPVPSQAFTVTTQSEKQLPVIPNLASEISFPPGWEHALIHNLAVIIAPEYGVEAPQTVQTEAVRSKGEVMLNAARNRPIDWPGGSNGGNIYDGWYGR